MGLVGLIGTINAQDDNTYNESVVVKGSYTPVIEQAEKLYFPAQIMDTLSHIEHEFRYSITPSRLRASYEPARIRAARIVGEPATKLYNNYLRLGMGNYWSPLADLYWCSTRDRLKTYGVRINHRSSWGKLLGVGSADNHTESGRSYGPNYYGNTDVTLFGKYIIGERLQLHTDLGYEHDHNLYYGFTDSTLQAVLGQTRDNISTSDYVASYNVATWNFGVRNMELDARKLGYAADLHVSDLWGKWGENEMNLNLSGDVHYGFNIANQYKGIAYLHVEWDFYRNASPDNNAAVPLGIPGGAFQGDTTTGSILKINPFVDFLFKGLQFRTGLLVGQDSYSRGGTQPKARIYPDVTVTKKFFKDNLVLSLAATGGVEAVSLNAIRQVNPYIFPIQGGSATSHYDFVFHTRYSFNRKLEANAEVSYNMVKDDFTFTLLQIPPIQTLDNIYMPLSVDYNRLTVGADIAFVNDEMITLRAGGHYYHYDTLPLYRPDWDALVSLDLNYHYKWLFHLEGQLVGKVNADNAQTLPMRYGIAAEVEYRHNRALSFFLKMDNLAFQRYWYWANYPSQRGLFILGLTYTIPHK